jgi:predicted outer membrane repeat protein
VELRDSLLHVNSAVQGGGVACVGGSLNVSGSVIKENSAVKSGGGIFMQATK